MTSIARALLTGLVDYAGLFPPAGLGMPDTVENYAGYQTRADAYALARLVVPVGRLGELEAARAPLGPVALAAPWPVSALAGSDPAQDLATIVAFNRRHEGTTCRVTSLELRIASVAEVEPLRAFLAAGLEVYCELPLAAEFPALVAAVRRVGARAKVRTGGVKPTDIPAAEAVLAFLSACSAEGLAFKATAGLHHPVRGPAPLTYEPGSACATMFGYLNIVLAATALWSGRPEREAHDLLLAEESGSLRFTSESVEWAGVRLDVGEIARARQEFMLAMGSCSFTEPMEEIRRLGLDPAGGSLPLASSRRSA